jgi:predicted nucleotidyltransferase
MSPQTQTHDLRAAVDSTGLNVLSLVEYGSRAHGTAVESSDHDLLGIYVENDDQIYGLEKAQTQVYRLHSDGKLEVMGISQSPSPAAADDIEMQFQPLRKFVSLSAAGNPTFLSTLWSPDSLTVMPSCPSTRASVTPATPVPSATRCWDEPTSARTDHDSLNSSVTTPSTQPT